MCEADKPKQKYIVQKKTESTIERMIAVDGVTRTPMKHMMEKPYLSVSGLDFMGHAVFQRVMEPLDMHIHKDCVEIVFVMRGEQTYYVGDTSYRLVGGQCFISFMDQPHRSDDNGQGVGEIYWMQLNLSNAENFLGFNRELSIETTAKLMEIRRHVFQFDSTIRNLVKDTFKEFSKMGTTPMGLSCLMHLVYLLIDRVHNESTTFNRFMELEKYIDAHLFENITIQDLSAACNFSVSTVQHKFREYYGRTPMEYISYKKITRSKELLLSGKSVTETAMILGFNTSDYFSTVFRKLNGMSPTQWLKRQSSEIEL